MLRRCQTESERLFVHLLNVLWPALIPNHRKNTTRLYFTFLRPEKMAKLPVILGNLDVTIDNVAPDLTSEI